jgi:hypothetical protein
MMTSTEKEFVKNTNNRTVDYIKALVCAYYEIDGSIYTSKKRNIESIKGRHMAIYMVKKNTNLPLVQIGNLFNCDHSTVVHIEKKFTNYIEYDRDFKNEISEIQSIIDNKKIELSTNIDLNKDYYYIPLNDFKSIKIKENKAIILVNFNEKDMRYLKILDIRGEQVLYNHETKVIEHNNKKMCVLEKIKQDEKNNNNS